MIAATFSTMLLSDRFQNLKANLELTDTLNQLVRQRHSAVRSLFQNNNSTVESTQLIGSLQRRTRIQPVPGAPLDIDVLVVLGQFVSWLPSGGTTPDMALASVHQTVRQSDRYSGMAPTAAPPVIRIEYADHTAVEFVPAYLDNVGYSPSGVPHLPIGRAYWVPKNGTWELADYNHDAEYISTQNAATNGWLIPAIKMLKAIKRQHLPQLGSYHLEILAADLIPGFCAYNRMHQIPVSFPVLIRGFFHHGASKLAAVRIPGSHSPAVASDPQTAIQLSTTFSNIARYIDDFNAQADSKQVEGWRVLFGDVFPTS